MRSRMPARMRVTAHDHPAPSGAHRDPGCVGRAGAVGVVQHLLDQTRPPRGRRRSTGDGRNPAGSRCSPGRARRWKSTGGAPRSSSTFGDGLGPNMLVDDGGDATLLVHKGLNSRPPALCRRLPRKTTRSTTDPANPCGQPGRGPAPVHAHRGGHARRHRGDHQRRRAALQACPRGAVAVPGDQRQRLGDEVQVRQQVTGSGTRSRRHQSGDRRHARRQARRRLGLRRRGQGCGTVVARPGCQGRRHEIDPICALQAAMTGSRSPASTR